MDILNIWMDFYMYVSSFRIFLGTGEDVVESNS